MYECVCVCVCVCKMQSECVCVYMRKRNRNIIERKCASVFCVFVYERVSLCVCVSELVKLSTPSPLNGEVLNLSVLVLDQLQHPLHHLPLAVVVQLDGVLL